MCPKYPLKMEAKNGRESMGGHLALEALNLSLKSVYSQVSCRLKRAGHFLLHEASVPGMHFDLNLLIFFLGYIHHFEVYLRVQQSVVKCT